MGQLRLVVPVRTTGSLPNKRYVGGPWEELYIIAYCDVEHGVTPSTSKIDVEGPWEEVYIIAYCDVEHGVTPSTPKIDETQRICCRQSVHHLSMLNSRIPR